MILLLLKLLIAHVLGDFVLQPIAWVKDKREKKYRAKGLYLHLLVHVFAILLLLQFNLFYWKGILIIVLSHFIIDLAKLYVDGKMNSRWLFIFDQIAHLFFIAVVVKMYEPFQLNLDFMHQAESLLLVLAILILLFFTSIIMKVVMGKWGLDEINNEESLVDAGKYIGILERLMVFVFIVLQQWHAIGWLLAAKSVFRFGDLSRAKDRKLTEYVLIGTFLSFAMAIAVGLLYLYLLKNL